jgi:hypothetical protein
MFRDRQRLRRLAPRLMHLGIVSLSSPDVLRFMGKKVRRTGTAFGGSELPISGDLKVRSNGARIKHRLGPNSIKLYDKAYDELGAVLRSEITISVPKYFKVFRRTDDPKSTFAYRPLRQSTADAHLRADVSQKALDRYCSALAVVDPTLDGRGEFLECSRPTPIRSRRSHLTQGRQWRRVQHHRISQSRPSAAALPHSTENGQGTTSPLRRHQP